jgi:hypothetical protein
MFQDNIALLAGNGQLMTPPPSDELFEEDAAIASDHSSVVQSSVCLMSTPTTNQNTIEVVLEPVDWDSINQNVS